MKSCIGASILAQGIVKTVSKEEGLAGKTVSVEYKYHSRFGVVKIVDKKS